MEESNYATELRDKIDAHMHWFYKDLFTLRETNLADFRIAVEIPKFKRCIDHGFFRLMENSYPSPTMRVTLYELNEPSKAIQVHMLILHKN